MAHENVSYLDYLITAPDTNDNSFSVSAPITEDTNEHTFLMEVTVGSIQFCVGQPVGAKSPVHAVGSKLLMTNTKRRTIFYKAASANDAFIIGF